MKNPFEKKLHCNSGYISLEMEVVILTTIPHLTVQEVFRAILQNMHQDREDSVKNIATRLLSQADISKFTGLSPCKCNANFVKQIVSDRVKSKTGWWSNLVTLYETVLRHA